jgi:hypothetical protein
MSKTATHHESHHKTEAPDRLVEMRKIGDEISALVAKLDAVQKSGAPDTTDGSHVLGRIAVFGVGHDIADAERPFAIGLGLVGAGPLFTFTIDKASARNIVMSLLKEGA